MKTALRFCALALCLALLSFICLVVMGKTYIAAVDVPASAESAEAFHVEIEQGEPEIIRLYEQRLENGVLYLRFHAVNVGKAYIHITGPDNFTFTQRMLVHLFGIVSRDDYFGDCTGARVIPIAVVIFLLCALWRQIKKYHSDSLESPYQYRNVRRLGMIVYIVVLILSQIPFIIRRSGPQQIVQSLFSSSALIACFVFPIAFVVFALVSVSHLKLMQREGRNRRNVLGLILGILLCLGTMLPFALNIILRHTMPAEAQGGRDLALYIGTAVENVVLSVAIYLECMLLGTIIANVRAGRHVPSLDKDFILIPGSRLNPDGTLTKLVQGRADRAVEFGKMQQAAGGPDLVYIPTGGQGPGEVLPEGEAIRQYLLSVGIPDDHIFAENFAANTEQSFLFSEALILDRTGRTHTRIAFSTTDYHVFHAGWVAEHKGMSVDGIGSRTKGYFRINAYIREFIALLHSGRRKHFLVVCGMSLLVVALTVGLYYLNYM